MLFLFFRLIKCCRCVHAFSYVFSQGFTHLKHFLAQCFLATRRFTFIIYADIKKNYEFDWKCFNLLPSWASCPINLTPGKAHCNIHTHCFLMCDRNTFIFNFKKLKDNVRKWIMLPLLPWQAKALKASSFSGVTSAAKFPKILARRLQENNVSCLLAQPRLNAIKSIPIETVSFFDSLILKSTAKVNQWNLLFMVRAESKVSWSYPSLWSQ